MPTIANLDNRYAAKSHSHSYASASHNHDSSYAAKSHTHDYAASNHSHDTYVGQVKVGTDGKLHVVTVGGADTALNFSGGGGGSYTCVTTKTWDCTAINQTHTFSTDKTDLAFVTVGYESQCSVIQFRGGSKFSFTTSIVSFHGMLSSADFDTGKFTVKSVNFSASSSTNNKRTITLKGYRAS